MSELERAIANRLYDWLFEMMGTDQTISAKELHAFLNIRQPYGLWISRHLTHLKPFEHYVRVEKDIHLDPAIALSIAAGGGSRIATIIQARYCRMLAEDVLKSRDIFEVMDTATKTAQADEFLGRELDPERCPTNNENPPTE